MFVKKMWYKSKEMMLRSFKLVSKVTFSTSKFLAKHIEVFLIGAVVVGVFALAIAKSKNNRQNSRENNRENNRLREENDRLRRENHFLYLNNMFMRDRNNQTINININNGEQTNERGRRSDVHSREESPWWKRFKQSTISWLDRKENVVNEWIDEKIQECRESYSGLSQNAPLDGKELHTYPKGCVSSNVSSAPSEETVAGEEEPPSYAEVMREKAKSNDTPEGYVSSNVPSAPPEETVAEKIEEIEIERKKGRSK